MPLDWEESDRATGDVDATVKALENLSPDAAQRFIVAYQETLESLCREIARKAAEGRPLPPDEAASIALARPTHKTRFQTSAKRSRFSSQGVWYVFYWLYDVNRDAVPETLHVVTVQSASSPPLWEEPEEES